MVAALTKAGVTAALHPVKKAGHLQALFDPGAMHDALAFADSHLKNANSTARRGVLAPENKPNAVVNAAAPIERADNAAPARPSEARDGN
jgi:hypothetical protein